VFGYNLWSASLSTVAFTALVVAPVFGLARELGGEAVARCAVAFLLLTPNVVMFTTTSMDGPFSVLPVTSVYFFYRALRRPVLAVACGLALAAAALMTYATVFIAVFFVVVALLERERLGLVAKVLAIALAAFLAAFALLFVATGYDPIAAARAAIGHDAEMMGSGHESLGRYLNLSLANLLVFLIGVGVPLTTAWLRETVTVLRRRLRGGPADAFVAAFSIALVLIAFSTLFTLEVERIWLFMTPFVAIAAARHVVELMKAGGRAFPFYWVAALTAVQLVAFEALLQTAW
jgi:4-amino-4-deoxy-L-arabinose transferase-like glycosyltransferase